MTVASCHSELKAKDLYQSPGVARGRRWEILSAKTVTTKARSGLGLQALGSQGTNR